MLSMSVQVSEDLHWSIIAGDCVKSGRTSSEEAVKTVVANLPAAHTRAHFTAREADFEGPR